MNQFSKLNGLGISLAVILAATQAVKAETYSFQIAQEPVKSEEEEEEELEIVVTGETKTFSPTSSPVYTTNQEEINNLGNRNAAEVLRNLPGFVMNNSGFGADIHTGTYYRGAATNQSIYLLNGRPIGTNINTYHGTTELNSVPAELIEKIEVSSGISSILYGSEAFAGVVNIITKQGQEEPRYHAAIQYGSFNQSNYRFSYGGAAGNAKFNLGYEQSQADNRYRVPVGAANRDSSGLLFNGDTATNSYFGGVEVAADSNNTIGLDGYKLTDRRGLIYFGFPLQRDRLDRDTLNIGLSWKTLLGGNDNSTLKTTLSYNQDFFNTYGPTQNIYSRTGTLDSQAIALRSEHQWQINPENKLTSGIDFQNNRLNGTVLSTAPQFAALNESENRHRSNTALFALHTWKVSDTVQTEVGVRQNFNSEFSSYLNPGIGTRWTATPEIAFRGSWVGAQRNPGIDQLYVFDTVHNWLPNPNLSPETGSSWTAGADVTFAENVTGQFTYFGSRLDNRLGIVSGKWANIGLVNTNGLETVLRWQIAPEWSTFFNYTYTDAKIETGAEKGLQLGLIPFSVAKFGIGYGSEGWQVNLLASYSSGSRRSLFNNPGETIRDFSPSYLNLDLNGQIPLDRNLAIAVYLENLADVSYEKANRIYQPGFTFRVGLQATF